MPAYRKYLIHVPYLSEYLYRIFCSLTSQQKNVLTDQEKKLVATQRDIHHFVSNEPMEKLLFMYCKLGYEFTINLGPTPEAIEESMEACTFQYDHDQKRIDAINVITRNKVCVVSSRDVMNIAMMCAQNCATDVYKISTYTENVKLWLDQLKVEPYDKKLSKVSENVSAANKMMLEQLNALATAEEIMNVSFDDLRLLGALYEKRNSSVDVKEISDITRQPNKKRYVFRDLEDLAKRGYVISDKVKGKKHFGKKLNYMISTKGIQKLMEYHYYVWEKAFGHNYVP